MRTFGKRAAVGAAAMALGTALFTGSALAGDHGINGHGGNGGNGGAAKSDCGIPVGITAGVLGKGGNNNQCNANGGAGGGGGDGVHY